MNDLTQEEILQEFNVPLFTTGPQHWQCKCKKSRSWHRCRGQNCYVDGCRDSYNTKGEIKSFSWGKTLWCSDCAGYVIYNPENDTIWEGPWNE